MTLHDRAEAFKAAYAKWPAAWPHVGQEQGRDVLYAIWVHRKAEWLTVGRIPIIRSTNHRVRLLTLFERQWPTTTGRAV